MAKEIKDTCEHGNHIMASCSDCNEEMLTEENQQKWHEQDIKDGLY